MRLSPAPDAACQQGSNCANRDKAGDPYPTVGFVPGCPPALIAACPQCSTRVRQGRAKGKSSTAGLWSGCAKGAACAAEDRDAMHRPASGPVNGQGGVGGGRAAVFRAASGENAARRKRLRQLLEELSALERDAAY